MSGQNTRRDYVLKTLLPQIIAEGKLKSNDNVVYKYLDKCEISEVSLQEAYMLTNCFRLKVSAFSDEAKKDCKNFPLFVKCTPVCKTVDYEAWCFDELFENEEIGYRDVLPVMGLTMPTPIYYGSYSTPDSKSLVTSDFSADGWRVSDSIVNLSLDHILPAVKLLGNFHGNAYAIKHDSPDQFFGIVNTLKDPRYKLQDMEPVWDRILCIGIERVVRLSRGRIPDAFLEKFEKVLEDPYHSQKRMIQPSEPLAILCHGDYLRNNIAFKFDENKKPIDAIMFDYQTLRYCSPMIDLCVLMANSTGKDVRPQNLDLILKTYHSALAESYRLQRKESCEIPEFLSYENLFVEYTKYLPFGISIAASFLGDLFCPPTTKTLEEDMNAAIDRAPTLGGKAVDDELIALAVETYELFQKFNLKIDDLLP